MDEKQMIISEIERAREELSRLDAGDGKYKVVATHIEKMTTELVKFNAMLVDAEDKRERRNNDAQLRQAEIDNKFDATENDIRLREAELELRKSIASKDSELKVFDIHLKEDELDSKLKIAARDAKIKEDELSLRERTVEFERVEALHRRDSEHKEAAGRNIDRLIRIGSIVVAPVVFLKFGNRVLDMELEDIIPRSGMFRPVLDILKPRIFKS